MHSSKQNVLRLVPRALHPDAADPDAADLVRFIEERMLPDARAGKLVGWAGVFQVRRADGGIGFFEDFRGNADSDPVSALGATYGLQRALQARVDEQTEC